MLSGICLKRKEYVGEKRLTFVHQGEEVTFLPPIVESAESSPAAAAQCAKTIRKYLKKDYWGKPSYQYNALMLVRILADNPGPSFTRNLDGKFADTVKDLLRNGYDLNVKQMLMEMLDAFEHQKGWDEGLAPLIALWRRDKDKAYKAYGVRLYCVRGLQERVMLTVAGTTTATAAPPGYQCAPDRPSPTRLFRQVSQ